MFLAYLNPQQKILFRDLCIFMAFADGNYADSEKTLLAEYCTEMGIEYSEKPTTANFDDTISKINETSTFAEKRAIGFELMGMVMADDVYEESEREFVEKYSRVTDIPMDDFDEMEKLITKMKMMNSEIKKVVFKT